MTNEEIAEQLQMTNAYLEVIIKAIADQKIMSIRLMAHQQAHLAALRNLLVRLGEQRGTLNPQLQAAFETALTLYEGQLEAYQTSGDVMKFATSQAFPDEIEGN
jgi:hypothetical protein